MKFMSFEEMRGNLLGRTFNMVQQPQSARARERFGDGPFFVQGLIARMERDGDTNCASALIDNPRWRFTTPTEYTFAEKVLVRSLTYMEWRELLDCGALVTTDGGEIWLDEDDRGWLDKGEKRPTWRRPSYGLNGWLLDMGFLPPPGTEEFWLADREEEP